MKTLSMVDAVDVGGRGRRRGNDAISQRGVHVHLAASSCCPASQAQRAGEGDHRAVVGAERRAREADAAAALARAIACSFARRRLLAPTPPATTSVSQPVGVQRALALDRQRVDHRVLEAARDVGAGRRRCWSLSRQASSTWVFRPLKLKSSPGRSVIGRENLYAPGRARFGQRRQLRAARIRQAHQLGGLVEGLAGGVVEGLAEQPVAADRLHRDQLGVAAGDQQRHERRLAVAVVLHQRRQQVAFHVVDADRRHVQRPGQRARHAGARPAAPRPGPGRRCRPRRRGRRCARPASARVWRTSGSSLRTWSRLASSGTTPPYSACRAIWL